MANDREFELKQRLYLKRLHPKCWLKDIEFETLKKV
jgi:hypothetical protein